MLAARGCPGVGQGDVLDGQPHEPVIETLTEVTGVLLEVLWPEDGGAGLLRKLGLLAATEWPPQ